MFIEDDSAFDRIHRVVEARNQFLKEHPELQPLQDEINLLLQKMGSSENRMAVLDSMMRERVLELKRHLAELARRLDESRDKHQGFAGSEPSRGSDAPGDGAVFRFPSDNDSAEAETGEDHPEETEDEPGGGDDA
ncbi:MAG: hypothetical protein KAY24_11025 [Candidatus Eisenbacteria sp.]|nr:hypothetical protein [Candidatus Eisenbacteria bacterium]